MKKVWCFDPQSGGVRIPTMVQQKVTEQAAAYAATKDWYPRFKLQIRYKSQFCYIDAIEENGQPFPVGRLRYFDTTGWSMAFFTYSNERYEPCLFGNGTWFGTLEQAIDICSVYFC